MEKYDIWRIEKTPGPHPKFGNIMTQFYLLSR